MRIATIVTVSVIAMASAGCGGTFPPPNDEWAAAQTDVGAAEAGGAPNVPDAKLHLQLSQEDLQKSKDLIDKDNKRAASLIARASAEAELALAISKSTQAKADAQEANDKLAKARNK